MTDYRQSSPAKGRRPITIRLIEVSDAVRQIKERADAASAWNRKLIADLEAGIIEPVQDMHSKALWFRAPAEWIELEVEQ